MERYRVDWPTRAIREWGSTGASMLPLVRGHDPAAVTWLRVDRGGCVGRHETAVPQLFMVVAGQGWVRADADQLPLTAGQAAFLQAGESHESGSDHGMTVVVIESEGLDPDSMLERLD